jgi:hypothetical protein
MATRMLCSGTGGPPSPYRLPVTCPVCLRRWDDLPLSTAIVPRHFIQAKP